VEPLPSTAEAAHISDVLRRAGVLGAASVREVVVESSRSTPCPMPRPGTCEWWQASANIPPVIWWNNMERLMLAVDDLGYRNLLD
jgi:hypothetical protein